MEWKPIETLHIEDGDGALLFAPQYPGEVVAGVWNETRGAWCLLGLSSVAFNDDFEPTHWMPLPPPPGQSTHHEIRDLGEFVAERNGKE